MSTAAHSRAYRRRLKEGESDTLVELVQHLIQQIASRDVTIFQLNQRIAELSDASLSSLLPLNGSLKKGFPDPPKETPSLIPKLIRSLDTEFEEIWPLFPRRVGKGAARRAYRAARKKVSFDVLLDGVRRLAVEHQATEAKFIPHPATWLNQERWLDAPAANGHVNGHTNGLAIRTPSSKCSWPACSCAVRSACQAVNGELHV